MKSSVIVFPGSNCDRDVDVALKKFHINNGSISLYIRKLFLSKIDKLSGK